MGIKLNRAQFGSIAINHDPQVNMPCAYTDFGLKSTGLCGIHLTTISPLKMKTVSSITSELNSLLKIHNKASNVEKTKKTKC